MNLRSIDLNLLVIFDALISEQSITGAAKKIGISQSAMSHALRRLRQTFNDDLVRRTPRGMIPTQRALNLATSVRTALNHIRQGIAEQLTFDPKTSERTLSIRLSDFFVACLLPRLCARVRAEAPRLKLVVDYPPHGTVHPLDESADIQLLACDDSGPDQEYRQQRLYRGRFVVVMRRGHPAAKMRMTPGLYRQLPHLRVFNWIIGSRALDDALERRGLATRPAVTLPSLSAVIPIIKHTDLCAILPEPWVNLYASPRTLAVSPLPKMDVEFTVDQKWHRRDDKDPGLRWLRRLIQEEFRALRLPAGGLLN
jgi:DNA-binding transcriptional LysR family regulator